MRNIIYLCKYENILPFLRYFRVQTKRFQWSLKYILYFLEKIFVLRDPKNSEIGFKIAYL